MKIRQKIWNLKSSLQGLRSNVLSQAEQNKKIWFYTIVTSDIYIGSLSLRLKKKWNGVFSVSASFELARSHQCLAVSE